MQATVKYLTNGYSVTGVSIPGNAVVTHYAATLNEAVYWIAQLFGVTLVLASEPPEHVLPLVQAVNSPYISQLAVVFDITGGGFITRAEPNRKFNTPQVEEFCGDMDAVSLALTKIYTFVPEVPPSI